MITASPSTATTPRTLRTAWIRIALVTVATCASGLAEDASLAGKRLLTGTSSRGALAATLLPRSEWRPFPRAKDREAWEGVSHGELGSARRDFVVARAEALVGAPWPALPATLYMDYARTGNRSKYEERYFERRRILATLVLAECLEHEGRFLDEIANGIWAICEESAWCIPAHATRRPGDPLHRPDVQGLDLFACETGMTLAQTLYLLEDELAKVSPAIPERIRREVESRIVGPYAAGDDFGSSGWIDGFNNWSPWCASNVLGAAMYIEEDRDRLAGIAWRLMQVVDRFIDRYGEDGGCDEGPAYWNEAGGAMLVFLELLRSRTAGAVDIYGSPKVAALGRYIACAHLAGPWFANFADADPRASPHPGKVYRYGERIGSAPLRSLALLAMRGWRPDGPVDPPVEISGVSRPLLGPLMQVFWIPADARPEPAWHPREAWFPDLQVLFARETEGSERGLVLAAKGGHNAESHNHNDLGHFILFLDGQPGIIDIGRETYTATTFSRRRYELWFTRGLGHNAPVVNGVEQAPGRERMATDVRFEGSAESAELSMSIEKAYPAEARVKSLRRSIELRRGDRPALEVRDSLELEGGPSTVLVRLHAAPETRLERPGRIAIACRPRALVLEYEPEKLEARIEPVPLEDPSLRAEWGERLWRIDLRADGATERFEYSLDFRAEE